MGIVRRERKGTVWRQYSIGCPEAGRGQGVCGGSREDRGGQCRTEDSACMCVSGGRRR